VKLAAKGENESETMVLKRIIAVLFSLADMAERAAGRSFPVRAFLLWVVRRVEGPAWGLIEEADDDLEPFSGSTGNTPADALALAASLRMVALALQYELARDRIFEAWWDGRDADSDDVKLHSVRPELQSRVVRLAGSFRRRTTLAGVALVPRLDTS